MSSAIKIPAPAPKLSSAVETLDIPAEGAVTVNEGATVKLSASDCKPGFVDAVLALAVIVS